MKIIQDLFLAICIILCCSDISIGQSLSTSSNLTTIDSLQAIQLSPSVEILKLADHQMLFIEDPEEAYQWNDLPSLKMGAIQHRSIFQIGKKDFNYWLVFKVENAADFEVNWWVDAPGNFTKVYIQKTNGQVEESFSGNLLKQADKAIPTSFRRLSYLPLSLHAKESATLFLNVKTTTLYPIVFGTTQIGQPLYFENLQHKELGSISFLDGLFGAALMICCLYCFGYFIYTRERFAIWAICYCLSLLFYFYEFSSTWYRLGMEPVAILLIGKIVICSSMAYDIMFARNYLNLKKIAPLFDKIFWLGSLFYLGLTVVVVLFYYFSSDYLNAVKIIGITHFLFHFPRALLGLKLISFRNRLSTIYGFGLFSVAAILIYAYIAVGTFNPVYFEYLKGGGIIYIISIIISLSIRAADSQQQKVDAEIAQVKDAIRVEELQQLDQIKSRFFANVTHELRTPLTLMLGPINSAIKSGELNNRNFTHLKTAQQNGKNLLKLIASILDLSKMQSGKMQLHESTIPLYAFTRRVASSFESHAQREELHFTFTYLAEENLQVELDKDKLEIILNNLLSNAIKFTPEGGNISVRIEGSANAILFEISDTGRGIHPKDLSHVFNRFYQAKHDAVVSEGGTGIGLALTHEYIRLMGGKIKVESELGKGSTFRFELPRKEVLGMVISEVSEPKEILTSAKASIEKLEPAKNSNQATILIVEDNYSLRDYLQSILKDYYNILTAKNGQVAMNLLQQELNAPVTQLPNLIISDIMMPVMDGFQFLEHLKSNDQFRHLPVVMLTARADIQDKLKALRIGVDDYILKPFEEEELLARISNLLQHQVGRAETPTFEEDKLNHKEKKSPQRSAEDQLWLANFETYVKSHISSDLLTVSSLTREFAMSESTLLRQLKRLTGLSPNQYLKEVRLNEALHLLENNVYNSIAKVANQVGYKDARSFTRSFKKRFGKLPSAMLIS